MTKYCNRYPFEMMTGCPSINVNLSFPTLDYCTSVAFPAIEAPVLKIPVVEPAPDIAAPSDSCINIDPVSKISFENGSNDAEFNGADGHETCVSGFYKLNVHARMGCPLSAIPASVKIDDGYRQLGKLLFHSTNCGMKSISAYITGITGSGTSDCPMDNVEHLPVQIPVTSSLSPSGGSGKFSIAVDGCGIDSGRISIAFPCPVAVIPDRIKVHGRVVEDISDPSVSLAVESISCMKFSAVMNVVLPHPANDLRITAVGGARVERYRNEDEGFPVHGWRIIGNPGSGLTGTVGPTGPRGPGYDRYSRDRDCVGITGPRGLKGPSGECEMRVGPSGPAGVATSPGGSVTCTRQYTNYDIRLTSFISCVYMISSNININNVVKRYTFVRRNFTFTFPRNARATSYDYDSNVLSIEDFASGCIDTCVSCTIFQ